MRVAVIIDTWFPLIGGGQINVFEISKRLAAKGITIDIITRNNGDNRLKKVRNLNIIKLGSRSNPYSSISKILFIFRSFIFIYKSDYDLVHAHAFLPGITAKLLMVFKHVPAIFTVHGTSINTNLNNYFSKWLEKFILTEISYTAQITVSQDFLKVKNINNKNIKYIPNGANITEFDNVKTKKASRPTLLFVGRLHPQKNLLKLIDAISYSKKTIPNIRLLIIGKGSEKIKILSRIRKLRLFKNVRLLGELKGSELIKYYKSSHIFILPSIYEGQPLTLLEAWAAKLPVIVTKTGDNQFIVKDDFNGFFINDPLNTKEISNVITKALKSKKLEKMGSYGYALVKNKFSWDNAALKTKKLYENLF